jgi:hypothetical protein
MHETHRLSWDGAVDADGHILEPSDLWETYLEPRYRDRSLRIVKDENGLDVLEIDGTPSVMAARGMPSTLAAMGRGNLGAMARDPAITYDNHAPPAATEPKARLELLDAEHIDAAVLYTTTGLLWEAELTDVELSQAQRVLEHHGDLGAEQLAHLAVAQADQLAPHELHAAGAAHVDLGQQVHDRARQDRLAGPRLADQPERPAAVEREADAVDRLDPAPWGEEVGLQVVDLEQHARRRRSFGGQLDVEAHRVPLFPRCAPIITDTNVGKRGNGRAC